MKHFSLLALLFSCLASVVIAADAAAPRTFRCSMHPQIQSDRPGKCTICGMALAPVDGATTAATAAESKVVTLSNASVTAVGVETSLVSRQPLVRTVRVNGRIEGDDTRHLILSARVPGRIEKLGVNYQGEQIAAGTELATIYSPEMLTAQRVYLERLQGGVAFPAAELAAAREQLQLLGLESADVDKLEQSRTPSPLVTVRTPRDGTVVEKFVYEGQYVAASDRLFAIADFSRMWFVFDAYEQDVPWLRVGQTIEITTRAVPGEVINTTVDFIDPNFDATTRTTRVRAALPNPHYNVEGEAHRLPHRVLAEGRVLVESPAALAAPRSAVLDAGRGPVAYVDLGAGRYDQRLLTLGRRGDALVEVLGGLAENERVVTTGALLIDAQAQLNYAASAHDHAHASAPTAAATPASGSDPKLAALAAAAIDASTALASDDLARYRQVFPALTAAAEGFKLPALQPGTDITSARRSFEPWSTAVADLLKPHRAHLGVKIFQCPMTPVLGKGRWVQRTQPLKNPFFGSSMADCGEEVP